MSREKHDGGGLRILGYILYGLLVTALLLYVRFPSDLAETFFQAKIAAIFPEYVVDVRNVQPWPLAEVRIGSIEVSSGGTTGTPLVRMEQIRLSPDLVSLLRGKTALDFSMVLYDGSLTGTALFDSGKSESLQANVDLHDIDLGQSPVLKQLTGRSVQGHLNGSINYSGGTANILNGSGEMDLRLSDGQVDLAQPLLGLKSVDLREVHVAADLNRGVLQLSTFEQLGQQARSTATGSIRLQKNLVNSRLSLRGSLEPSNDFLTENADFAEALKIFKPKLKQGRLAFDISGTVGVPRWKIL